MRWDVGTAALLLVLIAAVLVPLPRIVAWGAHIVFPGVVFYGPADRRVVALTIDDGPDAATTPKILDALDRLQTQATFFLVGEGVAADPALARAIAGRGHEIGHHLWHDRTTAALSRAELETAVDRTSAVLEPIADVRWLRPGGGWVNDDIVEVAEAAGLEVVVGDVLPLDTHLDQPGLVSGYLAAAAHPGAILTIHDRGPRGRRAVAILERLIPKLRADGYAITTLSGLVDGIR